MVNDQRAEGDYVRNDYPVVVMASDLNKILRSYIDSGRTAANAAECDPAWENLHARLKAVHACEGCNAAKSRAEESLLDKERKALGIR